MCWKDRHHRALGEIHTGGSRVSSRLLLKNLFLLIRKPVGTLMVCTMVRSLVFAERTRDVPSRSICIISSEIPASGHVTRIRFPSRMTAVGGPWLSFFTLFFVLSGAMAIAPCTHQPGIIRGLTGYKDYRHQSFLETCEGGRSGLASTGACIIPTHT